MAEPNWKYRSDIKVEHVEHMGEDARISQRARVSTGMDSKELARPRLKGLINYLVREKHTSTLESCILTVRVEAPIFVAREWMRHRTQSYNELSLRYSLATPEFYIPSPSRPLVQEGSGAHPKLVAGDAELSEYTASFHHSVYDKAWKTYETLVEFGVANEVSRNVLPVGLYTRFEATANLHNWFHFLELRLAENAQYEIRLAAQQVENIIADLYPLAYASWKDGNEKWSELHRLVKPFSVEEIRSFVDKALEERRA